MYLSLIGTILLASCATQFRDSKGFGDAGFAGLKTSSHPTIKPSDSHEATTIVDSVILEMTSIEVLNSVVVADSQLAIIPLSGEVKSQKKILLKEQSPQKNGLKKFLRKLGNEIAKISFYSSLIGLLSSKLLVFSVLAILLGVLATTIFKGIKVKFWAYLGIFLGVMGLISPALNTILAILILVALILILMKLMHWY